MIRGKIFGAFAVKDNRREIAVFAILVLLVIIAVADPIAKVGCDICDECFDDSCESCDDCINCLKTIDMIGVLEFADNQALPKAISSAIMNSACHEDYLAAGIDHPPRN